MSWLPVGADQWPHRRSSADPKDPALEIPRGLYWAGVILRTLFILAIVTVTVHVAMPQRASLSTLLETPGDLIRLILGFAVCFWLALQLPAMPKDSHAFRTWFYLGLAAVPFALICIVGIW
jgi:hypothetical protein